MPKYLDLSASVSVSMKELLGAKPAKEQPKKRDKQTEEVRS